MKNSLDEILESLKKFLEKDPNILFALVFSSATSCFATSDNKGEERFIY